MVTAIVIPMLLLYFYYITRKERKQFYEKWLQIGKVNEEAWIKGTIIDIQEKKQRYYYDYIVHVIDLVLQNDDQKIIARTQFPSIDSWQKPSFYIGDTIICYGEWKNKLFLFNHYQRIHSTTTV